MSWSGASAPANTSITRTPAPAVYGPLRASQPPSWFGSSPENVLVTGAACALALSSALWTRLSRASTAPDRPSMNVRYAPGSAPSASVMIVS